MPLIYSKFSYQKVLILLGQARQFLYLVCQLGHFGREDH